MIRGVFSLAGLAILSVLLLRFMQGEVGLEDLAIRGLVIVVCIGVIDTIAVPLVSAAIRAVSVDDPVEPTPGPAPSDGAA